MAFPDLQNFESRCFALKLWELVPMTGSRPLMLRVILKVLPVTAPAVQTPHSRAFDLCGQGKQLAVTH